MEEITVNKYNLKEGQIDRRGKKARALLLKDNKILISHYGGSIILPGGSMKKDEYPEEALIRELKEETGITYDYYDLDPLYKLDHYQMNYRLRDGCTVNRRIKTYFFVGDFKGIDLDKQELTKNEKRSNFYLELVDMKRLLELLEEKTNNPRKKFFDRELNETIKVYNKVYGKRL